MSEQARIDRIVICDACRRQITDKTADTQQLYGQRVDLCKACEADGWFICTSCGEVHNRLEIRETAHNSALTTDN